MRNVLKKKINALPPLPKTLEELQEFKYSDKQEAERLIEIIEKDPLIVSTLLKISNSAMFGFNNYIDSITRAVNLIGVNMTLSIAFATSINNALNLHLKAYGIAIDDFLKYANYSSKLVELWVVKINANLKDDLFLPAFLLQVGKFIISDMIEEMEVTKAFLHDINEKNRIEEVEKKYLEFTTCDVTYELFNFWGLNEYIVNVIENADNPDSSSVKFRKDSQILEIVKLITDPAKPLNEDNIKIAIKKATDAKLEPEALKKAIKYLIKKSEKEEE